MPTTFYISDLHLNHQRTLEHRTQFATLAAMNHHMLSILRGGTSIEEWQLVCAGDVAMNFNKFCREFGALVPGQPAPTKKHPFQLHEAWLDRERMILVAGNHDQIRKQRRSYDAHFHQIIGDEKSFETNSIILFDRIEGQQVIVLVSHVPQADLQGCDFNVHGHVHDDRVLPTHHPEYDWAAASPQHLNCCVEVVDYVPRTLVELIRIKQQA